ncbi:MAG: helix-turn-helix transcriptional regulator [Deltaproteobacteria bacterium]|nr:helix-turn-helix transcriptional regulator [Deltaproteobacteria bacterium]MDH4121990.1 helix-turn-helix transcriptional regulator [Deltaproteobacteria bacterium]
MARMPALFGLAAILSLSRAQRIGMLLPMLGEILGAEQVSITLLDGREQVEAAYFLQPFQPEAWGLYLREFHLQKEREAFGGMQLATLLGATPVVNITEAYGSTFYRSALYREVFEPNGGRHLLAAALPWSGRLGGVLMFYRQRGRAFGPKEEKTVLAMASPLANMLAEPGVEENIWREDLDGGVLVATTGGNQLYSSQAADEALGRMFSTHFGGTFYKQPPARRKFFFDASQRVMSSPRHHGRLVHQNHHGRFTAAIDTLSGTDPSGLPLLGIHLRSQIPQGVWFARRVAVTSLSPGEQAVCLLAAQGLDWGQVAQRMNVERLTVKSYTQRIYAKLGVSGREEMLARLAEEP